MSLPFRIQSLRTLAPLRSDLPVHRLHHARGRMDVADLVAQAHNAPVLRGLVDGSGDVGVQIGALFENVVESELADFGAHGRLGELRDCILRVFDAVAGRM